jgi:chromosome segregation ATPase
VTAIAKFLGIRGFVALGFAIALGVVMWRADAISGQRDHYRDAYSMEQARHAVTRQSVEALTTAVEDLNEQAEQRAEAFAEAQELAEKREKELERARRSSDATIASLRQLAAREGQCATPSDLAELAEGL